ncbi:MAG TPA: hypothetical protein VIT85_06735 [Solirubrobacterales bacterium]
MPNGFFGVVPQGEVGKADLDLMEGSVETLRVGIYWPSIEPSPGVFELAGFERLLGEAAGQGIRIQPFVYGTPQWLGRDPVRSPLAYPGGAEAWASMLTALIDRYGNGGSFWEGRKPLPVRDWQIWNEPNFVIFWHPWPSPREYARLLDVSDRAISAADPDARVIVGGVAPVGAGPRPWRYLGSLLRIRGVKSDLDAVALHPYSASPLGVEYAVRQTRRAMARSGAGRKPLLIGEIGVASDAEVPTGFDLGLEGQASFLRRSFHLLLENRRRWRIVGIDWFSWQDVAGWEKQCSFCQYAGLVDRSGRPKPSWFAFSQAVRGGRATSSRGGV